MTEKEKTVCIVGVAGFIGSHLLEKVIRERSWHGVVEGSKVRRRAKSVSNAIRAPKSVPNTPQSAPKCI